MRKKKILLISLCSAMCLISSACSWITLTDSSDTSSTEINEVKKDTKKPKEKPLQSLKELLNLRKPPSQNLKKSPNREKMRLANPMVIYLNSINSISLL